MIGLNVGSGQRRFSAPFVNVDVVSRPPDQVPDVIADGRALPFGNGEVDCVVLNHVYEHFHLGEADGVVHEAWRVLREGGSLIVTVPDLRALTVRWLTGQIDDFIFCVNLHGAYQGQPGDSHFWSYHAATLAKALNIAPWKAIKPFDWRHLAGSDIARDWWILGMECVK